MTKSRDDVFELIQKTLVDLFDIDEKKIVPMAHLYEDLDIDSIDAVDLIVRLKEETGKKPNLEEFKAVRTIEDLVTAVHKVMNP